MERSNRKPDNCMQNANKRKHVFKFLGLYCITLFFLLLLFYFCSVLYLSFNFYLIKKKSCCIHSECGCLRLVKILRLKIEKMKDTAYTNNKTINSTKGHLCC